MPTGRLDLTWHSSTGDIPDSLWHACFAPPHEGRFWFRALEDARIADQFTFLFGELRRDGVAIGIVPAFVFNVPLALVMPPALARIILPVARGPLRGFAHQRTLFIGNVAGEEGHVGLVPGCCLDDVVAFIHKRARLEADRRAAPMLIWKDFGAPDRKALDSLAVGTGVFRVVSYPGSAIELVPGGYAAFLARMRADRRWKLAAKLRRGAAAVRLSVSAVARPGEGELAEIWALFRETASRGITQFERLTPAFFEAISRCDEATFIVLRDAESRKMFAFMLMLDLGQRVINQFIGIDYRAPRGSYLYFQLFAAAYDWACATHAAVLQSGQTGYTAKLDTGHSLVPLWNYCEHGNPLLNRVFAWGGAAIGWETLDPQLAEHLRAHPEARPGSCHPRAGGNS